jgi:hypothetical protein
MLQGSPASSRFVPFWVFAGSAALAAGALVRSNIPCRWTGLISAHPWSDPLPTFWVTVVPLALAAASIATMTIGGRARGIRLTLPVVGSFLGYVVATAVSRDRYDNLASFCLLLQILSGASLVAAGNHVARLYPDERLPRILAGIGGAELVLSFLLSVGGGRAGSILDALVWEVYFPKQWGASLFAVVLLMYGVLGVPSPFVRHSSLWRGRAVSLTGHLLLVAFPFALYQLWWERCAGYAVLQIPIGDPLHPAWAECWEQQTLMIEFWLLGTGHTILLAIGVAAWTEDSLLARRPEVKAVRTNEVSG